MVANFLDYSLTRLRPSWAKPAAIAVSLLLTLLASAPAWAAEGDPAGWSVRTDFPQRRAFLLWTPLSDGPRVLALDCVPGNTLAIFSEDVAEDLANQRTTLSLANGGARFDIPGEAVRDARTGELSFRANLAGDESGLRAVRGKLLPVFEGAGPITMQIGAGPGNTLPAAGLAKPLARFKSVCFAAR